MDLIKRPKNYDYEQINVPISTIPDFPKECPCCGAELTEVKDGILKEGHYACGGKYASIPQIQNHTDKYRGACGEGGNGMKERIIINETDWENSIYSTKEWQNSVTILRYEHDYVNKTYTIDFVNSGKEGTKK